MKIIKYSRTSKINVGDFAISEAIEFLHKKFFQDNIVSHDILFENFDVTNRINTANNSSNFYKVPRRSNFRSRVVLAIKKQLFFLKHKGKIKQQIASSDGVILGGGNLFSENNGTDLFFRAYQITKIAKALDKKIYVYAVGLGPFQFGYKKRLKYMINSADKFCVRDETSKMFCETISDKLKKKVLITLDPAFVVSDMTPNLKNQKTHIGVNFMNFKNIVANSNFNLDVVIENLKKLYEKYQKPYKIINTSFGEDLSISILVSEALSNAEIKNEIVNIQNMEDIPKAFSNLQFFIASRMHSSIFAMSYHIPTLIYPWHTKVSALNQLLFGDSKNLVLMNSENFDFDEVVAKISNYNEEIDLPKIIENKKLLIYKEYEAIFK